MSIETLREAVYRGDLESIRKIIRDELNGFGGDGRGYTPLAVACLRNNVAAATELLKSGFAVDEVFDWASRTDRRVTYRSQVALLYAKSVEMVSLILSHGADIDRRDADGRTVLSQSVARRDIEVFQFLLSSGAALTSRVFEEKKLLEEFSEIASKSGKDEVASEYRRVSNQISILIDSTTGRQG